MATALEYSIRLNSSAMFWKESEEMKKLRKENEQLRKANEKLSKEPAAKPAHQEVLASENVSQTGNQKLDNLLKILKA